jgi:hypothetical protein
MKPPNSRSRLYLRGCFEGMVITLDEVRASTKQIRTVLEGWRSVFVEMAAGDAECRLMLRDMVRTLLGRIEHQAMRDYLREML